MAAETVKLLKAIGSYSEAEISDAIHSLDFASRDALKEYARIINNRLHGAPPVNVARKETPKKIIDNEQKFTLLIAKIRAQLRQYGSTTADQDEWKVDFQVDINFGPCSFDNIKSHHEQLVNSGIAAQKTKLLTFAERGRMYEYLKYQAHNFGNWKTIA